MNLSPRFSALSIGFLCLAAVTPALSQTLVDDNFSATQYVDGALPGQSGGTGWGGAWAGNGNVLFNSTQNLTYSATGYISTSGFGDIQSVAASGASPFAVTRSYGSVSSDYVWVSFLVNRQTANSTSDRSGITFTDGTSTVYLGTRNTDFGLGSAGGFLNAGSTDTGVIAGGTTYLIVAKIDLTTDTNNISAWLNPANLTSEAALGAATVTMSQDFGTLNGTLGIYFGESSAARASLDSMRIAYGDDSGNALYAVATGSVIPEPGAVSLVLGSLAVAGLVRQRRPQQG